MAKHDSAPSLLLALPDACHGEAASWLLALPNPCLLLVLQRCAADDYRSLFSAARAHSRLHRAAVQALRSITVTDVTQQQQVDSVMVYLGKHGQQIDSLELRCHNDQEIVVALRQLPPHLRLSSLQLEKFNLQLQPGNGFEGVLGAAAGVAALKQLQLSSFRLLDDQPADALAAALSLLPAGLEHLCLDGVLVDDELGQFPAGVLQQLQQLTYLELGCVEVLGPEEASSSALQPLQALTRLVDLRLDSPFGIFEVITPSMLSGMQQLTRLEVSDVQLDPGALAGKTKLQHLYLSCCKHGAAGEAQLLSQLQPLQQLTHLDLARSLGQDSSPPAAAYAALTASSKLQHLDIRWCTLPAGVWQHVFPAGRQLPDLRTLKVSEVRQPSGGDAQPPEGSRLASCCPGLRSLEMASLRNPELALVQGLSALHTLWFSCADSTAEGLQAVCQLTGLRDLNVICSADTENEASLLQLTQLKQLTKLYYGGPISGVPSIFLTGGDDEPIWRRLLRLHLNHPDPAVAQQAAAALAELQ